MKMCHFCQQEFDVKKWSSFTKNLMVNYSNGTKGYVRVCKDHTISNDVDFTKLMDGVKKSWDADHDALQSSDEERQKYRDNFYSLTITGLDQ